MIPEPSTEAKEQAEKHFNSKWDNSMVMRHYAFGYDAGLDKGIPDRHSGDCTIYRSLVNGSPEDGICTCGYGWRMVRAGDRNHLYSEERIQGLVVESVKKSW